ncbi:hypothetical protein CBL_05199 [Carabus blaptoides fortunei]
MHSWCELTTAFKARFLQADYDFSLRNEIRNRTQGTEEKVSIFIANMEGLFNRLIQNKLRGYGRSRYHGTIYSRSAESFFRYCFRTLYTNTPTQEKTEVDEAIAKAIERADASPDKLPEDIQSFCDLVGHELLNQTESKVRFDKSRTKARKYKLGDIELVEKHIPATGTSKKLAPLYTGPMIVTGILPNDRYKINNYETGAKKRKYEAVCAVNKMRLYELETESDSTD